MNDTKKVIYAEDLRKRIVEDKQIRGKAFAAVMRHLEAVPSAELRRPNCSGAAAKIKPLPVRER